MLRSCSSGRLSTCNLCSQGCGAERSIGVNYKAYEVGFPPLLLDLHSCHVRRTQRVLVVHGRKCHQRVHGVRSLPSAQVLASACKTHVHGRRQPPVELLADKARMCPSLSIAYAHQDGRVICNTVPLGSCLHGSYMNFERQRADADRPGTWPTLQCCAPRMPNQ